MEFSLQVATECAKQNQMASPTFQAQLVRSGYGPLHLSEGDQMQGTCDR
jgi:hypothetical protein